MSTQKIIDQTTEQATPSQNQETSNSGLTRRQFLSRGVATVALAMPALAGCEFPSSPPPTETVAAPTVAAPQTLAPTGTPGPSKEVPIFENLETLKKIHEINLDDYQEIYLEINCKYNYKGSDISKPYRAFYFPQEYTVVSDDYPAPTLRIDISDGQNKRVKIHLTNDLDDESNMMADGCNDQSELPQDKKGIFLNDSYPNCFHGDNTINIHYHGSHVQPEFGDPNNPGPPYADNVLIHVKPKDVVQYDFEIGPNQAPGTHWYHPHKHGATALHVLNAMVGALIVEGDFDKELNDLFGVHQPVEKVLVLQQFSRNYIKVEEIY